MNYNKKTIRDVEVKGKKVLLRCDFNVPRDKQTGEIASDKRIVASLPTIKYLLENGAKVIACSHMGKPKGEFKKELSLAPVAKRLSEYLKMPVKFANDVAGEESAKLAADLKDGEIMLMENVRFNPGEEKNDPEFAKKLAAFGEIYVSDAFGTVHRAHASTAGVAKFLPAYAGFLVERELTVMGDAVDNPKRPLVAILGGAKVSDKIGVISSLIDKADTLIIGGGMAYTFLKSMGKNIGKSLLEEDKIEMAGEVMRKAAEKKIKFLLPVDIAIGDRFAPDCEKRIVDIDNIPDNWMGLDIGDKTIELFGDAVKDAGTVVWNGPMGVFEFPAFANGTKSLAKIISNSNALTIVGGGDSTAAVEQMGFADKITHISTGGGASLEFLEGRELPGIACLMDR
ncbi:MAG: phosphoglycerate kinase [Clostridiales bacterium]|jgi:phosphoglycerate kinase|nr:phosphoglycerate kinase [Clostridiales bacterium]